MPRVRIEGSDRAVEADEPGGGRLLDICDDAGAPVSFSCRGASCGTCRVRVLEGGALLDEVGVHEQEVLDAFGDPPGYRLACAARIKAEAGLVRLVVVDD